MGNGRASGRVWSALVVAVLMACGIARAGAPSIEGCQIYPSDNLWNRDISGDALDPRSDEYVADVLTGGNKFLHADFGTNPEYGIPFVVVSGVQAQVPVNIVAYADESDPGPYPVPLDAPVEGGAAATGDRHVIALDKDNCVLYEMYRAFQAGAGWECDSAAKFDLKSNALRPDTWTSADAAGLPILPGLVRYDEVASGEITHAVRFTVHRTQGAYVAPATHKAGSTPTAPPMGARFRLKASFDVTPFTGQARVILNALKKYGMMVADNGSDWYISGTSDSRWDDDDLNQLKTVPGSAFEVVLAGTPADGGGGGGGGGSGGGSAPVDTDNDGVSDEQELVLGTNPNDANSKPGGTADFDGDGITDDLDGDSDADGISNENEAAAGSNAYDAGSPASIPLTVLKFQGGVSFKLLERDSLQVSGVIPAVPALFDPAGKSIVLSAGGIGATFLLDAKGKSRIENGALQLKMKPSKRNKSTKKIEFLGGDVAFKATLKKGAFAASWDDEGVSGAADQKNQPLNFQVQMLFNGGRYGAEVTPLYSCKAGVSGKIKK